MRCSAVVFDLDGVLLDTEDLYTAATQAVVAPFGKTFERSLKRRMMGRPERFGANLLVSELGLPIAPEEYLARRARILHELFAEAKPRDGAPELVDALHRAAIPMAIATGTGSVLFARKMENNRWLRERVQTVVCSDDPRVRQGKPAPDIFLVAAGDLRFAPEQCVVVEDSLAGVEAALAAKMRVVAAPSPEDDAATFHHAHKLVASLHDLTVDALLEA